ncbi:MAG: hypothetical protein QXL38_02575 [Candidatus Bathyarchaeia archaeon]
MYSDIEIQGLLVPGENIEKRWTFPKTRIYATNQRLFVCGELKLKDRTINRTQDIAYDHVISIEHQQWQKPRYRSLFAIIFGAIFFLLGLIFSSAFAAFPEAPWGSLPQYTFIGTMLSLLMMIAGIISYRRRRIEEYVAIHTASFPIIFNAEGAVAVFYDLFNFVRNKQASLAKTNETTEKK